MAEKALQREDQRFAKGNGAMKMKISVAAFCALTFFVPAVLAALWGVM
jgi:hypothetical protein